MIDNTLITPTEADLRTEVHHPLKVPFDRRIRGADGAVREEKVTELTITRPKGKHLKAAARFKNDEEAEMSLIGPLTGLSDKDVDEVDALDLMEIGKVISGFLGRGRTSGETISET